MYRLVLSFTALLLSFAPDAHGRESVSITLVLGEQTELTLLTDPYAVASAVAVQAAERLRAEPDFGQVRIAVETPQGRSSGADTGFPERLSRADLVLVFSQQPAHLAEIGPALRQAIARGGRVYSMTDAAESQPLLRDLIRDGRLLDYARAGGADNLVEGLKWLLSRDFGFAPEAADPQPMPEQGLWNSRSGKVFERYEDYVEDYLLERPENRRQPWVGVLFGRDDVRAGQSEWPRAITRALESRGLNVASAYGWPPQDASQAFFFDGAGRRRIEALVLGTRGSLQPDEARPVLQELDVPIVNAVVLRNQSRAEWQDSTLGLSLGDRFNLLFWPELMGAIAPTVVAGHESRRDPATGADYVTEVPIPSRIERLAERVHRWILLRKKPAAEKRLALIYFNSPPGAEHIEADYLNVPASLWNILQRLAEEGYTVDGLPASIDALLAALTSRGINIAPGRPGALAQLVANGDPVLLSVSTYRAWFEQQAPVLRQAMVDQWGEPEAAAEMVWRDKDGAAYFVLPMQRFGNVILAPQPVRGWDLSLEKAYSNLALPPHHQYLAFYLWLQHEFGADAMVHVGTHGSLEWLPGRDAGTGSDDASEVMIGDVPQIYPFVVAHVGDAMQAKRRGMAAIVSHLMPPFAPAELNSELSMLLKLVDDYQVAGHGSEIAAAGTLQELNARAARLGVLTDIGLDALSTRHDVDTLLSYLRELEEQWTPYGLHSFGRSPGAEALEQSAEAILKFSGDLSPEAHAERKAELLAQLRVSGDAELDALTAALEGRYIAAGPGGNPIRKPGSLPTGRNLYDFDPTRMPTPGAWRQGQELATAYVRDYRARHGRYPQRLTFVGLWDSLRSGGVTHAQILALLGVKPTWNERGVVTGVEVIAREELGRARVDVTVVPSGRSTPHLMQLIDRAVDAVNALDEDDNPISRHTAQAEQRLLADGVPADTAARMAAVRVFTAAPGSYGTGIDNVIPASNSWTEDSEIADVYFRRMGHLYGQGFWGDQPGGIETGSKVFRMALQGSEAALHTYSGDSVGVLDHSSAYRHLGGAAMAIRNIDGRDPESTIVNLEGERGRFETLQRFMGRELRTRYTNPEWVRAMLDEGYSGAGFVNEVTQRLWSFQVATPDAVDDTRWQEMYETYVADRNELGIRDRFRDAGNMLAYQAMIDRMIVAVNKGYWQADQETLAHLRQVNSEVISEAGVACDADSCSSPEITSLAQAADEAALENAAGFGLDAPSAVTTVRGQQLREMAPTEALSLVTSAIHLWLLFGVVALGAAYQIQKTRRERPRRATHGVRP